VSQLSADTLQRIRQFQSEVRECSMQMMMNALYIQNELGNVRMSDELRTQTAELCSTLIGTKHDLVHEIFELDERIEQGADNATICRYVERMVDWAYDDASMMHGVVTALDAAAQTDVMNSGAYLLVSESAVNILRPLARMRALADELTRELGSSESGSPGADSGDDSQG
jgi:hypothetical protein